MKTVATQLHFPSVCQFFFITFEPDGQFKANCSEVSLNYRKCLFEISCCGEDRELLNDLITEKARRACPLIELLDCRPAST